MTFENYSLEEKSYENCIENINLFFFCTSEYFEDGLNEMIYFFNTLYINVDWLFSVIRSIIKSFMILLLQKII